MFNTILKTVHFFNDRERQLYSAIHLRRQLISHMVGPIDLLHPIVKQGILENFGWQEEEDEDDDNALPKVGPFSIHSWAMYMKNNLIWGDSVVLHQVVCKSENSGEQMCPDNPNRPPALQCIICGGKKWFSIGDLNGNKKDKHNVEVHKK